MPHFFSEKEPHAHGLLDVYATHLECMAGTTGLAPATSAVTAKRKVVTYRKQAARMASFGAVRNDREPLSNPYQTHDLCPVNLRLDLCYLKRAH